MEPNIRDIISKAEALNGKISSLRNEKSLPTIELDIILIDIRTLYDEIKRLQTSSSWDISMDQETLPTVTIPDKVPEIEVTPVDETTEQVIEEEAPQAEATPIDETPKQVIEEEAPEKPEVPTTLADKYKGGKEYINESFAGNFTKNDISSKIQSKPIQNISSALGINDRFKLINDLFNGDKDSFQNTISVLDASSNFNDAFNYISSSFDWDMEEESVQLLLDLVRRKFIVNQDE